MKKPSTDNILYAYEQAAAFLDAEEWPGDDKEDVEAAYREVARRLWAISRRIATKAAGAPHDQT